jgi:hypothetical protein
MNLPIYEAVTTSWAGNGASQCVELVALPEQRDLTVLGRIGLHQATFNANDFWRVIGR